MPWPTTTALPAAPDNLVRCFENQVSLAGFIVACQQLFLRIGRISFRNQPEQPVNFRDRNGRPLFVSRFGLLGRKCSAGEKGSGQKSTTQSFLSETVHRKFIRCSTMPLPAHQRGPGTTKKF